MSVPQSMTIDFWSERRCAGSALQQGNAVTSVFVVIFSLFLSFQLITQHVVVVVKLPSQAGAILYKCTVSTIR